MYEGLISVVIDHNFQPVSQLQPVVTTIKTTALPINDLDFPAVTVCNQGFNVKTMYKFHKLMPEKWEPWFDRYVIL